MKKSKSMIIIGGFQGYNIFYDMKTKKVYSNRIENKVFPNLRWLVVAGGILGNALLIQINHIQIESQVLKIIVLCSAVILSSLALHFAFYDEYLGQDVADFNPKLYEHAGWFDFLEEERKRIYIILLTAAVSLFLTVFQFREYLDKPNMVNLIKSILLYFILYLAVIKSNVIKRMRASEELMKKKTHI
ncbi:ABC transporter permease [Streptococcus panodentis]|uniref:ABC transporter permease n=1 Tax=Streptococcus panodentis TaxID=1581472 RepID=A0ABS5B063_9STRE|nr:ABC transporter permease [Streptococcus panodentis]MBP2622222.1 ABC transporter permease [Streptococcus panodentis]